MKEKGEFKGLRTIAEDLLKPLAERLPTSFIVSEQLKATEVFKLNSGLNPLAVSQWRAIDSLPYLGHAWKI